MTKAKTNDIPLDDPAAVPSVLYEILEKMPDADTLRTDHPLQGETFGGITDALNEIARGLFAVADAIKQRGD
jgi:hypothetical protein